MIRLNRTYVLKVDGDRIVGVDSKGSVKFSLILPLYCIICADVGIKRYVKELVTFVLKNRISEKFYQKCQSSNVYEINAPVVDYRFLRLFFD